MDEYVRDADDIEISTYSNVLSMLCVVMLCLDSDIRLHRILKGKNPCKTYIWANYVVLGTEKL